MEKEVDIKAKMAIYSYCKAKKHFSDKFKDF